MASLITHPIVPLAAAAAVGRSIVPVPLLVIGMLFSVLPDLDSIGFRFGIPYAAPLGHRGFSHSILVALMCAAAVMPLARRLDAKPAVVFWFLSLAMISHGVLDAFTNAGQGVAFFWPFSSERMFFDLRPIEASPISIRRFLQVRGLQVLRSELVWVWTPCVLVALLGYLLRRARTA